MHQQAGGNEVEGARITTHQLCRAWLEEDGKGVADAGDAIDQREEDDIVLPDRRPGVVEKVEHGEVDDGLDDGVEVIYGVLGHEVGQGAHPGGSLPPVVHLVQRERPQGSNFAEQGYNTTTACYIYTPSSILMTVRNRVCIYTYRLR